MEKAVKKYVYTMFLPVFLIAVTFVTACVKSDGAVIECSSSELPKMQQETDNDREDKTLNIKISVDNRTFSAELYDSETVQEFLKKLPMTVHMSELNGNEKYCYFTEKLLSKSGYPGTIHAGDLMLYGSDCLVLFYEGFQTSYSYMPLGRITDAEGLAEAVGTGDIEVTFARE